MRLGIVTQSRIFIIEGLLTVVVGIAALFLVVDYPEEANFLTSEERQLLSQRMAEDNAGVSMNKLDWKTLRLILSDWKIYGA